MKAELESFKKWQICDSLSAYLSFHEFLILNLDKSQNLKKISTNPSKFKFSYLIKKITDNKKLQAYF